MAKKPGQKGIDGMEEWKMEMEIPTPGMDSEWNGWNGMNGWTGRKRQRC